MSSEVKTETALAALHAQGGLLLERGSAQSVQLSEQPLVQLANVRVDPTDKEALKAIKAVIGVALPVKPNTVSRSKRASALWLGPDEWMLRAEPGYTEQLAESIEQALGDGFFAVTDQTSGYAIVQLHGPESRNVLNGGCPLDLHPSVFKSGQCAQSVYFKASILVTALADDGNHWEIIVRRSFADYAVRMLLDAMGE